MIELRGSKGDYSRMPARCCVAVLKIGRAVGWTLESNRGPWDEDEIPEHNARALSKALYRVIHDVEADCVSEQLFDLVQEAGVGTLREVADVAYAGSFRIPSEIREIAMRIEVMDALKIAITALRLACPNEGDYQTAPSDEIAKAMNEYSGRLEHLEIVMRELDEITPRIGDAA